MPRSALLTEGHGELPVLVHNFNVIRNQDSYLCEHRHTKQSDNG